MPSLSDVSTPSWVISTLGATMLALSMWLLSNFDSSLRTTTETLTTVRTNQATNTNEIVNLRKIVDSQNQLLNQYVDLSSRVKTLEERTREMPPPWVSTTLIEIKQRLHVIESRISSLPGPDTRYPPRE